MTPKDGTDTREKLLLAAVAVFAEKGYKAATVREICRRAKGANNNAVNYYFGDKAKLYALIIDIMFAEIERRMAAMTPPPPGDAAPPACPESDYQNLILVPDDARRETAAHPVLDQSPPQARLRAFLFAYCATLYDGGEVGEQFLRIFSREMLSPSFDLAAMNEKYVRPQTAWGMALMRELMGPDVPDDLVRDALCSVVGQAAYYSFVWPVFRLAHPDHPGMGVHWPVLAERIFAFSMAGIAALRATYRAEGQGAPS
ncbi:MAG: CerR family C-terminal domain-containing protein [Desulfovibrionaceae bacterium]|nr:CerR family C-terminal domain-containing protein [Desulfovibrionaceae bacterium]